MDFFFKSDGELAVEQGLRSDNGLGMGDKIGDMFVDGNSKEGGDGWRKITFSVLVVLSVMGEDQGHITFGGELLGESPNNEGMMGVNNVWGKCFDAGVVKYRQGQGVIGREKIGETLKRIDSGVGFSLRVARDNKEGLMTGGFEGLS